MMPTAAAAHERHELAAAVGVRNIYVSQIENNHRIPSRDVLQKIAEALGDGRFLLMETDNHKPVYRRWRDARLLLGRSRCCRKAD